MKKMTGFWQPLPVHDNLALLISHSLRLPSICYQVIHPEKWINERKNTFTLSFSFDWMTSLSAAFSFVSFPLSTRGSERRGLNQGQHSHYFWLHYFWLCKNRCDREWRVQLRRAHKRVVTERIKERSDLRWIKRIWLTATQQCSIKPLKGIRGALDLDW